MRDNLTLEAAQHTEDDPSRMPGAMTIIAAAVAIFAAIVIAVWLAL